jgi:hypothetical protein
VWKRQLGHPLGAMTVPGRQLVRVGALNWQIATSVWAGSALSQP